MELRGVKTTADKFAPIIKASHGQAIWLSKTPKPRVSASNSNRNLGGSNWIALKSNNDYNVRSVKDIPLLPEWIILLTLLSAIILLWWKEGRD